MSEYQGVHEKDRKTESKATSDERLPIYSSAPIDQNTASFLLVTNALLHLTPTSDELLKFRHSVTTSPDHDAPSRQYFLLLLVLS